MDLQAITENWDLIGAGVLTEAVRMNLKQTFQFGVGPSSLLDKI